MGLIPGSERFRGGRSGNPLQYSGLKNSMDRGATLWWVTVHGVAKSQAGLSTHIYPHRAVVLWKQWQPQYIVNENRFSSSTDSSCSIHQCSPGKALPTPEGSQNDGVIWHLCRLFGPASSFSLSLFLRFETGAQIILTVILPWLFCSPLARTSRWVWNLHIHYNIIYLAWPCEGWTWIWWTQCLSKLRVWIRIWNFQTTKIFCLRNKK